MSQRALHLLAAFAAVYVIWGSTYLAIRLLVDTLPGFIMVGLRFLIAGLLLAAYAAVRGARMPSVRELRSTAVIGLMLLFCGTGAVVWSADYLPSGLMALLVAMEPMWIALMLWIGGRRPTASTVAALGLGFLGAAVLAAPGDVLAGAAIHLPSVAVINFGCLSWAAGSLYARRAELPSSPVVNSAAQMIFGGLGLLAFGLARGELSGFEIEAVSATSFLAFLYLIVFGSLIAFSAYAWLIRTVDPTLVSTHTFVNPVVAVFLGWWIADEVVGPRTLVAAAAIVLSVILLTMQEARRRRSGARSRSHGDQSTAPAEGSTSAPDPPAPVPAANRCEAA
ncbi:MAG: EamA family transporter [Acidobacteriota bacterium]